MATPHITMVTILLLLLPHQTTSDKHYIPKLQPRGNDPNLGNTVMIKVVDMEESAECKRMEGGQFCSDRDLESLWNATAALCRSVGADFYIGTPIAKIPVTSVIKPAGYDFDCPGSANNVQGCTVHTVACNAEIVITCKKPGLLGTCNSPCGCMAPTLVSKIIGGHDAALGEFPWQVTITDRRYMCGGTIVDAWHVVTAAHCIHSPSTAYSPCKAQPGRRPMKQCTWLDRGFEVIYGTVDFHRNVHRKIKQTYAETVYIHGDYIRDRYVLRHDVAVIKLAEPLELSAYVHPACLPDHWEDFSLPRDTQLTISGFGDTSPRRDGIFPDILQKAKIDWVDLDTCNKTMYGLMKNEHFCAGDLNGKVDACRGDSGGPLVYKNDEGVSTLVGIVSFSYGCAIKGHYSMYTDVVKELKFIRNVMMGRIDKNTIKLNCKRGECKL